MYASTTAWVLFASVTTVTAGLATGGSALAAFPINLQLSAGQDLGGGVLHFDVSWQSSSGNLQDLAQCTVGENVKYVDSNDNPYIWPDPAWIHSTSNPTISSGPADTGAGVDDHYPGNFDDYMIQSVGFSARQYYWYNCPGTGEKSFPAASRILIVRSVAQVLPYDGHTPCAQYVIGKKGYLASFIPSEIVTCGPQAKMTLAKSTHRTIAEAPSQSDLRIIAHPNFDAYGLREPVFVDLQVTNLSAEPTTIDLGGDGKTNLLVTVKEPSGQSRTVRLPSGGLKSSGKHLLAGNETYTEQLILNEWNEFGEVGDYSVNISLVPEFGQKVDVPPMADLHLSIGPRNESKLRALAKTLADRAIDGSGVAERRAAALALSYVSDPVAIPEMRRVLSNYRDAGTAVIAALAHLGGSSAVNALRSAKRSPNREVRAATDRALRVLRGVPALRDGKPVPEEIVD